MLQFLKVGLSRDAQIVLCEGVEVSKFFFLLLIFFVKKNLETCNKGGICCAQGRAQAKGLEAKSQGLSFLHTRKILFCSLHI